LSVRNIPVDGLCTGIADVMGSNPVQA